MEKGEKRNNNKRVKSKFDNLYMFTNWFKIVDI